MNRLFLLVCAVAGSGALLWWWLAPSGNEEALQAIPARDTAVGAAVQIIAFGDSLTAGYGLPAREAYPAQLEAALRGVGFDVTVVNAGVSGETTRGNLERAAFIRSQNPDIVLLGIGGNDALRLLPFFETEKNLRETITTLRSGENPPVLILLTMQAPLTSGLGYKRDFDALYKKLAEEYNLITVPFLTTELFLDSGNKLPDGIHYNKIGYEKVVNQYLVPTVTEVLERVKGE